MRLRYLLIALPLLVPHQTIAGDADSPHQLVAQFYKAHSSKADPLQNPKLLANYFDPSLLKLYLKDKEQSEGEVGRLDGDPLYDAQDTDIKKFAISAPKIENRKTLVTVSFTNMGKPTRVVYVLSQTHGGWRISDIRYDDGSALKQILQTNG
jgi:hypothetical protein